MKICPTKICVRKIISGPILESKNMRAIYQKKGKKGQKRAEYFKICAKMCKISIFFEKGQPHVCDYCTDETARIYPGYG